MAMEPLLHHEHAPHLWRSGLAVTTCHPGHGNGPSGDIRLPSRRFAKFGETCFRDRSSDHSFMQIG